MSHNNDIHTKILTVLNGETYDQLIDYALTMAFRLDCEIVALDVTDEPLKFSGKKRQFEVNRFYEEAQFNSEKFLSRAESMGIVFHHIIKLGYQDDIIEELIVQDPCIRYVLTNPEQETVDSEQEQTQIPVFYLSSSRLQHHKLRI